MFFDKEPKGVFFLIDNVWENALVQFRYIVLIPIQFVGFSDLRWPLSQQLIQRKRDLLE